MSDKEFKENTKAPDTIVPEEPADCRNPDLHTALNELNQEIICLFLNSLKKIQTKTKVPIPYLDLCILMNGYSYITNTSQHHAKQFGLD
jgi:hypothetical protein